MKKFVSYFPKQRKVLQGNLSGYIPTQIGTLPWLRVLVLLNNKI